jgi:hypothetical protein
MSKQLQRYPLNKLMLFSALMALAGCDTLNALSEQQAAHNRETCAGYGLLPGSAAYVQCVSQGPDAYAKSRQASAPVNTGAAALPAPDTQCKSTSTTVAGTNTSTTTTDSYCHN